MAQTQALIETLKKALKAQGLTYRDVAGGLGLSEASVKRLFSEESFSLERLDQVCGLMGMEISDLVRQMEAERRRLTELTEEQEQEVVSDVRLLLVAFLVLNGFTFEQIGKYYALSEAEIVQYLAQLDRLKVIDLLPGNRIKLRISPQFAWRRNGPIQRFFHEHLARDFLKSRFDQEDEVMLFQAGILSPANRDRLMEQLRELTAEFIECNRQDSHLPLEERSACSMILAMRPWRPEVFEALRRQ